MGFAESVLCHRTTIRCSLVTRKRYHKMERIIFISNVPLISTATCSGWGDVVCRGWRVGRREG